MLVNGLLLLSGIGSSFLTSALVHKKYHKKINYKKFIFSLTVPDNTLLGKKGTKKKALLPDKEALQETDIASVEEWIDGHLTLSSIAMGTTLVGIWLPPFSLISIATLAYLTIPMVQRSYHGIVHQRKLKVDMVNLVTLPLLIGSGYLPVAAFGYWLYYMGLKVMAKAKNNSHNQLTHIFQECMSTVWIVKDGIEIEINFEELQVGDIAVIQGGETIPVDGTIIKGFASIDQRAMTGEAQPAEKETGESVFAFTLMLTGKIWVKVEKAGDETVASQIQLLLNDTTDYTASVELRVEELSDRLAFPSLVLGALALPVAGYTSALVVLDSALIDHLNITGNLNVLSHLSNATQHRLLIKDGRALEHLKNIDTIVFDKTGTLTQEIPHVGKIYANHSFTEEEVLIYAATAEYKQKHPIAKAILKAVEEQVLTLPIIDDTQYEIGYGIKVTVNKQTIRVGSGRFMALENISVSTDYKILQDDANQQGYSLVYIAVDQQLAGIIELHPTIRPEAKDIIKQLKQRGLSLAIISGDHEKPTQALAGELGIDLYFAETMPQDKADIVKQLQQQGKSVCFVGDGINDTIALKQADVSISLNSASSIAADTAQIVLMDDNLQQFPKLFELSESLESNYKKSLLWDIIPNMINIGGAYFFHLGVYGALGIYSIGLAGGVLNGVFPALKAKKKLPEI
ncbi:MAG: heavy metal translocating P-type ATPase [gamma proteobacterium symbiont of Taylorina sp.]|nr:heavy metal translocating P-type ATPase [gamma proteobacterium symbiont of Taylorina sp.]